MTIHPFDDGNGRIGRAIADMQLARSDGCAQRFYSMSTEIRKQRKRYYEILEETQKGSLDITNWLQWFLGCLDEAIRNRDQILETVLTKADFWKKYGAPFLGRSWPITFALVRLTSITFGYTHLIAASYLLLEMAN